MYKRQLVDTAPYAAGWMARVRPSRWAEEKATLIDAAAYRRHILRIEPEARLD